MLPKKRWPKMFPFQKPRSIYADLYASKARLGKYIKSTSFVQGPPTVIKDEVESAERYEKRESCGKSIITVDLQKGGGGIAQEKLAKLFSECIRTLKVPLASKNDNLILIHKKAHVKGLKI